VTQLKKQTCAQTLANYAFNLEYKNIPQEIVHATKMHTLDTLGVALAGSTTKWAKIVAKYVKSQELPGKSTVLNYWNKTRSSLAAFANGTFSHSLDYDDDPGIRHIGAVIVPASIAIAEEMEANGQELLTAINIGYDIVTRIEEAFDGETMFQRGFHPTAVCGVFGAAAAASKILRLDKDKITNALGIAGSFASGLMEFLSDGSMTKRIHPGWAAQNGITAAYLALNDFIGPKTIFEGKHGLKGFSREIDETKLLVSLGERFDVARSSLKKYPSCLYNASAIDGILELYYSKGLRSEDVKSIDIKVRSVAMRLVGDPIKRKYEPQTMLDAQMSMPYSVAVALIDGKAYLKQFSEERYKNPDVQQIAKTVKVSIDPELDKLPSSDLSTILQLTLKNGSTIKKRVDIFKGDFRNPLTQEEVEEKFNRCASRVLSSELVKELANKILKIEKSENIGVMMNNFL
jgi:2-methylcitrate dehydratase PrpD